MRYGIEIIGAADSVAVVDEFVDDAGMHVVADASGFGALNDFYRQFLWENLPEQDLRRSTAVTLDYLETDVVELELLGSRKTEEHDVEWALYVLFRSNGGTRSTESLVAAHWCDIWYRCGRRVVSEHLREMGFRSFDATPTFVATSDIELPPRRLPSRVWKRPRLVEAGKEFEIEYSQQAPCECQLCETLVDVTP